MKILHVVGGELNSGASIGALNLHEKLLKNNIKSFVLTNSKISTRKKSHIFFLYKNYYIRNFIYILINYLPKIFYIISNYLIPNSLYNSHIKFSNQFFFALKICLSVNLLNKCISFNIKYTNYYRII